MKRLQLGVISGLVVAALVALPVTLFGLGEKDHGIAPDQEKVMTDEENGEDQDSPEEKYLKDRFDWE